MASAESTTTLFWLPETVSCAQLPLTSYVLEKPLMLTAPPSQTTLPLTPTPDRLRLSPAAAVGTASVVEPDCPGMLARTTGCSAARTTGCPSPHWSPTTR